MFGADKKFERNFEKPLDKSKVMWYTLKVPQNAELLQIMECGILKIEQQTNLKEWKKNPEIPRESEGKTAERLEEQSLTKEKRSS